MAKKMARNTKAKQVDNDGWETLGGGEGTEPEIGEVIEGVFYGSPRSLKPLAKGQKGAPIYLIGERSLVGGAVLRMRIEEGKVAVGDKLEVTRLPDLPAKKGQSAGKNYKVRVQRLGAATPKRGARG